MNELLMAEKILMITRQGFTERQNGEDITDKSLSPWSVGNLYKQAKDAFGEYMKDQVSDMGKNRFFISHSSRKRTYFTGIARVAGIFRYEPIPACQKDLQDIRIARNAIGLDKRLDFDDIIFNEDELRKGEEEYISNWVANSGSSNYEGSKITAFDEVVKTRKGCLARALNRLKSGKDIGILATHGGICEALLTAAINSSRSEPVRDIVEIGGPVAPEGFALIQFQYDSKGIYNSWMQRNGIQYPINLKNLFTGNIF